MDEQLVSWLLESNIPSIRYRTLVDLVGLPTSDPRIANAWQEMQKYGPIPSILNHQADTGGWQGENSYYTPKYRSTHWSMLLLAELSADPGDPRPAKGAAFMLDKTEQEAHQHITQGKHGLECFWANLLRYAIMFGDPDDSRLKGITHLLTVNAPGAGWRCQHNDERPCAWGAARTLWGLASLPSHLQTAESNTAIERGLEFLLDEHDLLKADYPVPERGKVHPLWTRVNFPLFYQADRLLILRTLRELDMLVHPGAQSSIDWLAARRGRNGRWRGSSPYRGRTWREMGDREETDRWVSLQAALVIEGLS